MELKGNMDSSNCGMIQTLTKYLLGYFGSHRFIQSVEHNDSCQPSKQLILLTKISLCPYNSRLDPCLLWLIAFVCLLK